MGVLTNDDVNECRKRSAHRLQLSKANASDTEAPFLDLHLSVSDGFVSTKNYDKRDGSIFMF